MQDEGSGDAHRSLGLCGTCRSAQLIVSSRGSEFLLCEKGAAHDSAEFPKYPRLPVLVCSGYERK